MKPWKANRYPGSWPKGRPSPMDLGATGFTECRLRETSYRFARLGGSAFEGSDCLGAYFHGADLSGARLVGVIGLAVDPQSTKLVGATVDAATGVAILESLGINLYSAGSSYDAV